MIRSSRRAVILLAGMALSAVATAQDFNVSIAAFDPGIPDDMSLHRDQQVFPRIREIEALFLPFVLRETLAKTREWGAVRLLPEPDMAAEVLISGTILRSDGERLEVNVQAVDASGRVWFDKAFASTVPDTQSLYDDIAIELRGALDRLDGKARSQVFDISLLRYAVQLVPSAFGDYLGQRDDGIFVLHRLPARNDPLLGKIERIRSTEYVITDAVDAKYRELHAEIEQVYSLWREYRRKVIEYQAQDAAHARAHRNTEQRGSYEWLKDQYDNYKWDRITAQEQDRLAVAFNNEVGPRVDAIEARVAELRGWVQDKYAEWQWRFGELLDAEAEAQAPRG